MSRKKSTWSTEPDDVADLDPVGSDGVVDPAPVDRPKIEVDARFLLADSDVVKFVRTRPGGVPAVNVALAVGRDIGRVLPELIRAERDGLLRRSGSLFFPV